MSLPNTLFVRIRHRSIPASRTTGRVSTYLGHPGRVQIVGTLPIELNRRVRAAATRRKVSLNAFLIDALTQALATRRAAESKEPR